MTFDQARRATTAPITMFSDAAALPKQDFIRTVYSMCVGRSDMSPADLEDLSNRLGRIAWHRARGALTAMEGDQK